MSSFPPRTSIHQSAGASKTQLSVPSRMAVQALNKLQASSTWHFLCFHSHEALVHELLQRRLFLASPRRLLLQEAFLRLSAQFRRPLWFPLVPYFHHRSPQHPVSPSGVAIGRDPYCVSRPAQG